ncbi:hypothetical protein IRJ41_013482 [Triplophysa rosa]|uniref:Uncharacterized protein n=1 Tax=Triplophysa rosa TaxID=992332 RepID=A0A9W7WBF5_TRIRA|nr:hypothetical protein IRJ41_013482 [Triplophysa rosa]
MLSCLHDPESTCPGTTNTAPLENRGNSAYAHAHDRHKTDPITESGHCYRCRFHSLQWNPVADLIQMHSKGQTESPLAPHCQEITGSDGRLTLRSFPLSSQECEGV